MQTGEPILLGQADLDVPVLGLRLHVEMDKPLREKIVTMGTTAPQGTV